MMREKDLLLDYMRQKNLQWTSQRELVLQEILETPAHFDADALLARLRERGHAVSRATVYRTLPHLQACGLIREVLRCQGRAQYERTATHHDHMVCVRCGKIIEFRDDRIEKLQENLCRKHGFKPLDHRLGIRGICNECQQRAERNLYDGLD